MHFTTRAVGLILRGLRAVLPTATTVMRWKLIVVATVNIPGSHKTGANPGVGIDAGGLLLSHWPGVIASRPCYGTLDLNVSNLKL